MWQVIQHNVQEIKEAYGIGQHVPHGRINNFDIYVKWIPLEAPQVKLNTDKAVETNRKEAGCGSVIRDHLGCFQGAFAAFLGDCLVLLAELCAILFGVHLLNKNGFTKVIIESNSSSAIKFVKFGCPLSHQFFSIIEEIKLLSRSIPELMWCHTKRANDILADAFAKYVISSRRSFHEFSSVPAFWSQALSPDADDICFRCGC
ncbi:Ribonuclease H-like superfamily [Sesbania bispinosa]|nr:Ribonuclease H-like superfamily [Sesbania bispinosa]